MTRYVALLRAVNVGGRVAKMTAVKAAFEELGHTDVVTYIQSGNVVFAADQMAGDELRATIEAKLEQMLGYRTEVFVLGRSDLEEAAANNPFEPAKRDGELICHLMFLSAEPEPGRVEELMKLQGDEYRFAVRGKVFYFCYDRANAGPNRRNLNFEKILGVTGTTRTWKVVDKLIELAG